MANEDEIVGKIKRNFHVTNCPIEVIKEFKRYCDDECGGVYSVGIIQLLKTKYLYENLIPLVSQVVTEVDDIKAQLTPAQNKSRRMFG